MLTEKQIELLESVAVANENVLDEKFDMEIWLCNTAGCLIGNWLANGPKTNGEKSLEMIKGEKANYPAVCVDNVIKFRMSLALQDFFNLDDNTIRHLFLWDCEEELPTRQQAVTRLRNFIKTGGNIDAALAME